VLFQILDNRMDREIDPSADRTSTDTQQSQHNQLSMPRAALPTKAPTPPSGQLWLHEIKHDDFRVVARKDGDRVRLYSRPGNDLTWRFPLIVEALAKLRSRFASSTARPLRVMTPTCRAAP
jgi:ATP-dependent DNA ligase